MTATTALNAPFQPLVERIRREATVEQDRILKIDHFLNHRIEPAFMAALGRAMAARVAPFAPDLLLTAEASGIAPTLATALVLDVPMVYAKKYDPVVELPAYSRVIPSPTKGGTTRLVVAARYLEPGQRVALVDDFLANGRTALALAEIVADAGAELVVAGFLVEKLFQHGRAGLAAHGIPIATLAQVERLAGGQVWLVGDAAPTRSLAELNGLSEMDWTDRLGGIFESSPWIAAATWSQRPFASVDALHAALCQVMYAATPEQQVALIAAHPDLVGRAALAGTLSSASTGEQAAAGLDQLSPADVARFQQLNQAYHERFGFPFVICARLNKKASILAGFETRLQQPRTAEIATALGEISKIARLRLADLLETTPA